jgi:predicted amidophosphoribosyltransferase
MYCPYCKEELKVYNGELYCKAAGSYFSKHIEKAFDEKIANSKKDKVHKFKVENIEDGRFFCVNCGNKMKRIESMHEVCKCCGFEINKSMYFEIVEINPHCSY